MALYLDCMPCLLSQACNLAKKHIDDKQKQYELARKVLQELAEAENNTCAPLVAQKIHRLIKEMTDNSDPYKETKEFFNQKMLQLENKFNGIIEESEDQMSTALKLATAGNIIDFGPQSTLEAGEVFKTINETMNKPFSEKIFQCLKDDLANSKVLLYLGDNAGEIVFDKLFIKTIRKIYPELKIYFATRGKPAINDATRVDALVTGIDQYAEIIDNGTDIPGTVPSCCSSEFLQIFNSAGLIISKGQGNFESLIDTRKDNIYYIFLCKCNLFESKLGVKKHDIVLYKPNC